ncbi:MAG TPA: hypothetical protein VFF53_08475 [Geobacteraceae bacterium]|nr:hypothetical protein [Geobacteraceae bacterium]
MQFSPERKSETACPARSRFQQLLPLLLLVGVTGLVYGVAAKFQFLATLDDFDYIKNNETVRTISLTTIREAWSAFYVGNYAPLHIMSYMLDHALWGENPAWYHLENVAIHTVNGVLFYLLLQRLSLSVWQASAAAWIFLLHPVQVETVAWVSQRKNLLAMLFFLAAMHCYLAYMRSGRIRLYLPSLVSAAMATLSKSIAVILPAVLLLFEFSYGKQGESSLQRRMLRLLPFAAVAAAVTVMAIASQADEAGGGRRGFVGGSPLTTFFTMVPVVVSYLQDCFWPFALTPYYMVPVRPAADAVFLLSILTLLALAAGALYLSVRSRPALFWYGLFFIALVPVLHFVPLITLKNDRYLYFPLLGFAVVAAMGVSSLLSSLPKPLHVLLRYSMVVIMLIMPVVTFKQVLCWRDDFSVWNRAIAVDPENRLAWLMLAKVYTGRQESQNALHALSRYEALKNIYGPVRGYE